MLFNYFYVNENMLYAQLILSLQHLSKDFPIKLIQLKTETTAME